MDSPFQIRRAPPPSSPAPTASASRSGGCATRRTTAATAATRTTAPPGREHVHMTSALRVFKDCSIWRTSCTDRLREILKNLLTSNVRAATATAITSSLAATDTA